MKKMMRYVMQFMICLVISGAMLVGTGQTVFAVTTLPAESDTASEGCVLLGERGDFYSNAQEAIDRINEIRYEACTTGVKDPRNTSRTLTEADYVPLQWSQALELIARLRAAETVPAVAMNGKIGHFRANGKSALTVSYGGVTSSSEDIAWNSGTGMMGGIEQWYKEKEYWDNNTEGKETGHYTSMINPNYRYVGLGAFKCYNSVNGSSNVVVGELSGVCGNLGQEMLSPQMDIIQTIEVKKSYITGYTFLGKGTLNTDQQCQYTPLAIGKLSSSSQNAGYFWLVDEYSLTVSDPDIASIDENNNVTAHKAGTFGISIHSGGEILHTQTITVRCNHDKVLLSEEEATCTATGTAHYHCDICGKDFDETIAKKPHDYVFGEAGDDGKSTGVCSVCDDTVTVAIPTGISNWWSNSSGDGWYSTQFPSDNPVGSTLNYNCTINGGETGYKQIVFESTDESVISSRIVTSTSGSLAINGAGIVKLTVYPLYNKSLAETYTLRAGSEGDVAISRATVSDIDSMTYTGSEKKPTVTVTYRGVKLTKGTDYTVAYEDNINAGQAKIIISGAGIFGGTAEKTFTINPIQLTKSNVTLSQTSYECDGTAKEPAVTVKYNSKTLTAGEHYDVTYENNIRPGTATVTVTGKGNYAGTIVSEFTMAHSNHTYTEETTKEPTCTQDGTKTFTCSLCGDSYTESIPARHSLKHTDAVPATCEQGGNSEYWTCDVCGKLFSNAAATDEITEADTQLDALGHDWGEWTITKDPTCTAKGTKERTCPVCNKAETEDIAALGHDWSEDYCTDTEPTCVEPGSKSKHCSRCSEKKDITEIPATGIHTEVTDAAVAPSCTGTGLTEGSHCAVCGEVITAQKIVPETGHSFGEWGIEKESTCTETGIKKRVCSACGVTETENIDLAEHEWDSDYSVDVPAGCTQDGSESIHCKNCTATKDSRVIPAGDHTPAVDKAIAPSCTEEGKTEGSHCSVCGEILTPQESVPALGHEMVHYDAVAATCTAVGHDAYDACSRCDYTEGYNELPALGHAWKHTTNSATLTKNGSDHYQCSRCPAESTTTIYYPKTFTLSTTAYTYSGTVKKPAVTVKNSLGKTLPTTSYSVTYSNNKYVAKGTVKVTLKAPRYYGTKTLYFKINPKGTYISKLTPKKRAFTATWKKQATQTTGYQIQYSTSSKFASGNKLVTVAKTGTTSKTISKLKAKKRYYVRVRTYKTVSGTRYYSAWSAKKYVKTK